MKVKSYQEEGVYDRQPDQKIGERLVHLHLPGGEEEDTYDVPDDAETGQGQDGHPVDVEFHLGIHLRPHRAWSHPPSHGHGRGGGGARKHFTSQSLGSTRMITE